ncbi:MAG: mercuric ion binding protein [Glaciecola sp.]|jgi:mercuric ion binding protein
MRKLIVLGLMLIGTVSFAQNKNAKATIEVDGVCLMCKTRIEKASIKTKGVKLANWDVKTHELKLIFDERKTSLKKIKESIVAVGHDTKDIKAKDDVYNNIDPCCKYRDEKVIKDHEN